jgi:hypothetical protein
MVKMKSVAERHALLDAVFIRFVHGAGAAQIAAALGALGFSQVPFAGAGTQHLAAGGDFESLGRGLLSLNAFWTSHKVNSAFAQKERAI